MIEELLPPNVVADDMIGDDLSACLMPEEAFQMQAAIESRRKEFTTTRACARRALLRLGLPPAPILQGTNREPIWPPGIVGSLTHCPDYRAAAVAKRSDWLSIGIDAEIHDALPTDVVDRVLIAQEISWLASSSKSSHWDRVIFSAKESIYKAWFPLTQLWLDFEDVAITLNPEDGRFNADLRVVPPPLYGNTLDKLMGRFRICNGFVLTAVTIPVPDHEQYSGIV
jgi:4'-phosphopantetheinyl transferase EntD